MSDIDRQTVAHTARLARLAVGEEEMDAYVGHFRALLDFVVDLTEAPIGEVEPMAHPLDLQQRLRSDEISESDAREAFQKLAPESEDGYYLVPKVIE